MSDEKFLSEAKAARHALKVADHMISVTYSLVKDPKLLLAVVENLQVGLYKSLSAFLHYERFYRRIPPFQDNIDSMLSTFTLRCVPTHEFTESFAGAQEEISTILQAHKSSAMEFTRDEKFVMATEKYSLKTLDIDNLKTLLKKTKAVAEELLGKIEEDS